MSTLQRAILKVPYTDESGTILEELDGYTDGRAALYTHDGCTVVMSRVVGYADEIRYLVDEYGCIILSERSSIDEIPKIYARMKRMSVLDFMYDLISESNSYEFELSPEVSGT